MFGIKGIERPTEGISENDYPKIFARLEKVNSIMETEDVKMLEEDEIQFLEDTRRATTDTAVRKRRAEFLIDLILA
jgi:hypothetical protein